MIAMVNCTRPKRVEVRNDILAIEVANGEGDPFQSLGGPVTYILNH